MLVAAAPYFLFVALARSQPWFPVAIIINTFVIAALGVVPLLRLSQARRRHPNYARFGRTVASTDWS